MRGDLPLVIVTVLHWNGGEDTLACLASIRADGYPRLSIVLVDNASTDGIADQIAEHWSGVTLIRNAVNTGFTGGQNQAIEVAMGQGADFVLMLNQDATLVPGCIAAMVDLAAGDARAGLVSPVIHFRDDPARTQFCGAWVDATSLCFVHSDDTAEVRKVESDPGTPLMLWGTALLIRRAVIDSIGVLDQRFFAYYEDFDYSFRAAAAGWRNRLCFSASVLHQEPETRFQRAAYYFYLNTRNQFLWWSKNSRGAERLRAYRIYFVFLLREAAKLRDQGMQVKAEACILGLWHACTGRVGAYDPKHSAPRFLVRLLLWHPYLLANLLEGRFGNASRSSVH